MLDGKDTPQVLGLTSWTAARMELLFTKTGDSLARGIPCPPEVFTYYFICLLDNQGEILKRHNLQANTLNYSQLCHLGV